MHRSFYGGNITGNYDQYESSSPLTLKRERRLCCQRPGTFLKTTREGEP